MEIISGGLKEEMKQTLLNCRAVAVMILLWVG